MTTNVIVTLYMLFVEQQLQYDYIAQIAGF